MDAETTIEGVNRLYSDHLASVRMSGVEHDETEILLCWDQALAEVGG